MIAGVEGHDDAALASLIWPIRTGRLVIRRAEQSDLSAMWNYRRLPELGQWRGRLERDEAGFTSDFSAPGALKNTMVMQSAGVIVGDLYLRSESPWSQVEVQDQASHTQAEIGWALDPAFTGRGLATEGARALISACFAQSGLRRIYAEAFAVNARSVAVMRRIPMRSEALFRRQQLHRELGWLDGVMYAVLKDEWPPG